MYKSCAKWFLLLSVTPLAAIGFIGLLFSIIAGDIESAGIFGVMFAWCVFLEYLFVRIME
jgi:hypothetical protein